MSEKWAILRNLVVDRGDSYMTGLLAGSGILYGDTGGNLQSP